MEKQTREQVERLIRYAQDNDESLWIVSGEGENGTSEEYEGKLTAGRILNRLTRERCGGDRWARVDTCDDMALMGII